MHPPPDGWPRVSSAVFYEDAQAAIDWLGRAFGFEPRLVVEGDGGSVVHSELVLGEGVIMVGQAGRRTWAKGPRQLGGANTQSIMVYVDDASAHCQRARAAGATIATELKVSDYGEEYWKDRSYEAIDLEGHHWWFCERLAGATRPRTGGVRVQEHE